RLPDGRSSASKLSPSPSGRPKSRIAASYAVFANASRASERKRTASTTNSARSSAALMFSEIRGSSSITRRRMEQLFQKSDLYGTFGLLGALGEALFNAIQSLRQFYASGRRRSKFEKMVLRHSTPSRGKWLTEQTERLIQTSSTTDLNTLHGPAQHQPIPNCR